MISIIAPVLNEASALPEFLAHARSLEGNKEIIVVDGGSSDGTGDLARQTPGIRVLTAHRTFTSSKMSMSSSTTTTSFGRLALPRAARMTFRGCPLYRGVIEM